MFLVCLVLNEVFLIVCCNTPNPTKKAIHILDIYDLWVSILNKPDVICLHTVI